MLDHGKKNLLGQWISAVDYETAVAKISEAASQQKNLSVSALAVHGLMTGVLDKAHGHRLNQLDLVTPDGQPVRWGLNLLHRTKLADRVYGPSLMLDVLATAEDKGYPVFFYGSTTEKLELLRENIQRRYPALQIAGMESSKFRCTSEQEMLDIASRIKQSGARIALIGLGCPRQEVFVYEYRNLLAMPVIAVGAAFDYHADLLREPPGWMQRSGLQWLYRLGQEPRRLWRRYLILNPLYLCLLAAQYLRLWRPDPANAKAPERPIRYG